MPPVKNYENIPVDIGSPYWPATEGIVDGKVFRRDILGTTAQWDGDTFNFVSANPTAKNVLRPSVSTTVTLTQGSFSRLKMLADTRSGKSGVVYRINYTDCTSTNFSRDMNDWTSASPASGETNAITVDGYADNASNLQSTVTNHYVNGYRFTLNPAKAVSSFNFPADSDLRILAITL